MDQLTFTAEIIKAVAWPMVVFGFLVYLLVSKKAPDRIIKLFNPFRSFKLFGTEFVINEEVGKRAEEVFSEFRKQVRSEYDRKIDQYALMEKLESTVQSVIMPALKQENPNFRCTIHVPDILFAETLYQLLDYYPHGAGRGRTWSSRFGIIGIAWRSGVSRIEGRVPTEPTQLIREWGMSREEAAAAGEGRRSFACAVLRDEDSTPLGIFYMDSTQEEAFGREDAEKNRLVKTIAEGCKSCGLTSALSKLNQDLRGRRPQIKIHEHE